MPNAEKRYSPAKIARSVGPTMSFHSSTTATANAAKGTTTAPRFAYFSIFDMLFERTDVFPAPLLRMATSSGGSFERTDNRPWATLDPRVAEPLRPRLPTLVNEVIGAVQAAVPEYRRLDPAVTRGVHVALDGFLALIAGGAETRVPGREVYEG